MGSCDEDVPRNSLLRQLRCTTRLMAVVELTNGGKFRNWGSLGLPPPQVQLAQDVRFKTTGKEVWGAAVPEENMEEDCPPSVGFSEIF